MALKDDILALPSTVGEGSSGHLGNHATLHAGLKDHETRITTAESNKADKTALDARVPSNMALRLDTTVGTRIFAGNTMIHGDTGWRDMRSYLAPGWTATTFRMRRTNFHISYQWIGLARSSEADVWMTSATPGFSPGAWCSVPVGASALNIESDGKINYHAASPLAYALVSVGVISGNWPTTLPGLPA